MSYQKEAFYAAVQKLRKQLKDMDLSCDFYPETPLRMIVTYGGDQESLLDEDFTVELTMAAWDEIRYSFDGCKDTAIPAKLLGTLKNGFKKIAGAYLVMQHYMEIEGRRPVGAPQEDS